MTETDLPALVDAAVRAAFDAGREIISVYGSAFAVELKDDRSPLTEADKRAHRAIVSALASTALPVLSEEGRTIEPTERQAWERYWLVDPLDGTKEFVKRNGEFTVNIALMARAPITAGSAADRRHGTHVPVAGVLYVPVQDTLYFAWEGGGAYRLEQATTRPARATYERAAMATRLPVPQQTSAYTIVASRSHQSPETLAFIQQKEKEHGAVALTNMGSALKICLVAEGAADVYPRYAPTMEWDTAAGHAICTEAGKDLIDLTTHASMRYNKNELLNNWFIVN
ncbi:MAG: 3'(2'),5'-bisphosphate nucleotidase CysQ [Flavobacteriales bacterium]